MERHFPATARDLRHAEGVGGPFRDAAEIAADVLKTTVSDAQDLLKPTLDAAHETVDKASALLVEKIKERPVTAAVAAAGMGLILGLMLTRRK